MHFEARQPDYRIEEYLDAFASAWLAMDFRTFADTIDMFYYDPLIAPSWTETHTTPMIDALETSSLDARTVARLLHNNPSTIRCLLHYDLLMARCARKGSAVSHRIFSFYTTILEALCREDPFAKGKKNIIHEQKEVEAFLIRCQGGTPDIARTLGRLTSACYNLSYALYSDMNPQLVYDNLGPYVQNNGRLFAMKIFHNLKPIDLWPETKNLPVDSIDIGALYEGITLTVDCATHAVYTGDQIQGLRGWWCMADGRLLTNIEDVNTLRLPIENMAMTIYQGIKEQTMEERKELYWYQKAWGYKYLFNHLGLPWKPAPEVIAEARGKPLFKRWNISQEKREAVSLFREIFDPRTEAIPPYAFI